MAATSIALTKISNNSGTSPVTSSNFTTLAGDFVSLWVAVAEFGTGNPTVSGVTLNGSTAFTAGTHLQNDSGDSHLYHFYLHNVAGGSTTNVVISFSAGATLLGWARVIRGAPTSGAVETNAIDSQTGTAAASGNASSAATDSLFESMCMSEASGTVSAGSGWSLDDSHDGSTGANFSGGVEHKQNTGSTGPNNGTFTVPSGGWISGIVVIKSAGSDVAITPGLGTKTMTGRSPSLNFSINMPDQP